MQIMDIEKGSSAVEAAGKIHSDIARGFVRAEVVHIDEILNYNSEKEAKEKGIIKGEGKITSLILVML